MTEQSWQQDNGAQPGDDGAEHGAAAAQHGAPSEHGKARHAPPEDQEPPQSMGGAPVPPPRPLVSDTPEPPEEEFPQVPPEKLAPRKRLEVAEPEDMGDGYSELDSAAAIAQCMESLSGPGGASILFDVGYPEPQPVIVVRAVPGKGVLLDLTAIPEWESRLREGVRFRLMGQGGRKLLRTPWMKAREVRQVDSRIECLAPYPAKFEVLQRRESFRAELRMGMEAWVTIKHGGKRWEGRLRNLSTGGCLVYFPMSAAVVFSEATGRAVPLTIRFPRGDDLELRGFARHQVVDPDARELRIGFEFLEADTGSKTLWFFVREIEREGARIAATNDSHLEPSALFEAPETPAAAAPVDDEEYATAMARRLAPLVEFLEVQILALREGRNLDGVQLSRMAERLLSLLAHDRNEVLFAIVTLSTQRPLVAHSLAVAARLADLATSVKMPRVTCKAITAAALVHDLGKVLLPREVLQSKVLDAEQRKIYRTHVMRLRPFMTDCRWLAPSIIRQVILEINERMDGSGYPRGLQGEELHQLSRFAMVVDVVDALGRNRPDRPARGIDAIYRLLAEQPGLLDRRWLLRYRQQFGVFPVGTLLRFNGNAYGWVRLLDEQGRPSVLQMTDTPELPTAASLGEILSRDQFKALGPPIGVVVPDHPEM